MSYRIKSIKVSDITHKHLTRMGRKGESYDSIIAGLIKMALAIEMQEDIKKISEICADRTVDTVDDIVSVTEDIFNQINFDYGIYPDWELSKAIEMAMDEDMVGPGASFGDRKLPLSEVVINCYCNYLEMPSPTTGLGAMIPPLAPH